MPCRPTASTRCSAPPRSSHSSRASRASSAGWKKSGGRTDPQRRYEPPGTLAARLGNTEPGDGKRFKGRGPIQITGRFNYAKYGALLGVGLVAQPQLAATPGFMANPMVRGAARRKASMVTEPLLRGQESIRRIRVAPATKDPAAKAAARTR